MKSYEQYSKEDLIQRIEELEDQLKRLSAPASVESSALSEKTEDDFKIRHGHKILEILPDMLSVLDLNYNYVALASSEATVHIGGSSDHLIGKNLADILPPDAYRPVKENFDRVVKTKKASIGYHDLYVDGTLEYFENRVIPLEDNLLLCICRNISDRVRAQKQLQIVTSAVNNSMEEIYAAWPDGTMIFANKQFINHHCLEKDISCYKIYDFPDITSPEAWNEHVQALRKVQDSPVRSQIRQAGNEEISSYILPDDKGLETIWFIARDISERIRHENKIRELNQLLETILNNLPVYLFVKDSGNELRYLYWNRTFEKISGIPASYAIGKTDTEIFPNSFDSAKFRQDDLRLLTTRQKMSYEEEYTTTTGEKRMVHTIKTLVTPEGRAPLLIGISWDITDQKRTEKELIKARNKAEESDRLKSAFLANMSHEIRTPLNAIVGFSQLIEEAGSSEEQKQYYDIIHRNADLLLQLINDILDLSKIEAGILEFVKKPVNLNKLCQDLFDIHIHRMPENVELIVDRPAEDWIVTTDEHRLHQVLTNLLTNAQKFTSQGKIRFGYTPKEDRIEFYVEDTGIGISPENTDKIFDRFVQLNTFIQGTGLGLPICRMIIENLGGKIWVKSEKNKGSVFYCTIPLQIDDNK